MTNSCECHNWDRDMGEGRMVKLVHCGDGEYHHPACPTFEAKWYTQVRRHMEECSQLMAFRWRLINTHIRFTDFVLQRLMEETRGVEQSKAVTADAPKEQQNA